MAWNKEILFRYCSLALP